MRKLVIAFLAWAMLAGVTVANNTRFLPGDAFFFSRLDQVQADSLGEIDSPLFQYGRHRDGGYGCGYIGFETLKIENMPEQARDAVGKAYKKFSPTLQEDALGRSCISVFVVNKDYDWKKLGLGFQYNENWADQSVEFGAKRDHVRLESFFDDADTVARNWRDSKRVDCLKAICPDIKSGREEGWSKTPVQVQWEDCQLLIIPNRKFNEYVNPEHGVELIQIVGSKYRHLIYEGSGWSLK